MMMLYSKHKCSGPCSLKPQVKMHFKLFFYPLPTYATNKLFQQLWKGTIQKLFYDGL